MEAVKVAGPHFLLQCALDRSLAVLREIGWLGDTAHAASANALTPGLAGGDSLHFTWRPMACSGEIPEVRVVKGALRMAKITNEAN